MQRVGVLVELPRVLREHGADPDQVLMEVGVAASLLSDPDNHIPMIQVCDLAACCAEATGQDGFWMKLGTEVRLHHMGVIGELMSCASNLREALADLVMLHPRYAEGGGPYLMNWGDDALLIGYRLHLPHRRGATHMARGAVSFGFHLVQQLSGATAREVLVSLPPPTDRTPYAGIFGAAKLRFGAHHFGLVYDREALQTPMQAADPAVRQGRLAAAAQWLQSQQPDLGERVMRVLVPSVLAGGISLAEASERLGTTPATLVRDLRRQGTSFRKLLNRTRFEMAGQFLLDTRMSIAEVAATLGYSEISAFNRFFAGIGGAPPAEWRAMAMQAAAPAPQP
ncbi:hypothetical protein DK847_13615 [Aestuariivirga litoralis]|uniref:HTH araC/xylS-type domain-containing protein n=1 Tax=Aestuariivirga litoralis TaxID=2650924 RepID=A0A2W2AL16_9HYPH|nr:AraC family transcriptional regulator [Aestuariivirga litoralis]PZF76235.1 hypothetical protein DK847_13615 [Aestuariivirga litoralis]